MIVHNEAQLGPLGPQCDGLDRVDPQLAAFARLPTSGLFYAPSICLFKISLLYQEQAKSCGQDWNSSWAAGFNIFYCPFTGRVLPGILRWKKWRFIKQIYGIPKPDAFDVDHRIPSEFVTSEWWVKRGITSRMRPEFNRRNWIEGDYTFPQCNFSDDYPRYSFSRYQERPPHLCQSLGYMFSDARVSIAYIPYTREYGIRMHSDIHEPNHYRPLRMKKIDYCPSCGTKFPPSLKARWQEEIRKSGRDPNDDGLPDKYLSDIWWKELGL